MEFITNYAEPWALVRWGGDESGKRPRTRLAFVREAIAENGRIVAYRAHTRTGYGAWTKRPRRFTPGEVIKTWRHCPSATAIRRTRERLPVTA